jgi:hypothetical protein
VSVGGRFLLSLGVAALVAVSGASATTPTVVLSLSVSGAGTVKVSNEPVLRCSGTCHATFRVKSGSKLVVLPKPSTMWRVAAWAGACKGSAPTCTVRMTKARHVSVKFASPGTESNPIAVGSTWFVPGNWLLQVNGVTANANGQVQAADGTTLQAPSGTQFLLLDVAATYKGSGTAGFGDFARELSVVDGRGATYRFTSGNGCGPGTSVLPSHDIQPKVVDNSPVGQNQTVSGYICFQVATVDASSLVLVASGYSKPVQQVFFALH